MSGVAVVLPGTGYTVQRPLLHWSGELLRERGWAVREVAWAVTEDALEHPRPFVERHVAEAFDGAVGERLVVAKSFGCFGLPWAVREHVPGVWLTPVLADDALRAEFIGASGPHLAVGGDSDPLWADGLEGGEMASVTVPGADHGLQIPGDWEASLATQRKVLRRIARFVDEL